MSYLGSSLGTVGIEPHRAEINWSLPYLSTKNETMAPLHVATLTVQRELPTLIEIKLVIDVCYL